MYRYFLTTFQKVSHLKKIKCHKTAKLGWALAAYAFNPGLPGDRDKMISVSSRPVRTARTT